MKVTVVHDNPIRSGSSYLIDDGQRAPRPGQFRSEIEIVEPSAIRFIEGREFDLLAITDEDGIVVTQIGVVS